MTNIKAMALGAAKWIRTGAGISGAILEPEKHSCTILVLMLLLATPVLAEGNQIIGVGSVIGGGTIEIHGQLRVGRSDRTRHRGLPAA